MSSLKSRIDSHFVGGSRESVLHLLTSECSDQDANAASLLREVLLSESPVLAKAVALQLFGMGRQQLIADVALQSWPPPELAWDAIATIPSGDLTATQNTRRLEWADRLMDSDSERLQVSNTRLICQQIPELKSELMRRITPLTVRTICVFATDDDLEPLICALKHSGCEPLPTVMGLALTAQRLAKLSVDDPTVGERLAVRHGYLSPGVALSNAKSFLEAGICHVNDAMLQRSVQQVQHDVLTLSGLLIRGANGYWNSIGASAADRALDFRKSDFDLGVLFAAVREIDIANIELRRQTSPFDLTPHHDIATDAVRFMHVPESLLRRSVLDDAVEIGQDCDVPDALMSQFICERAAAQLAPTDEARTESDLFLRSRWTAMATLQNWSVDDFQAERLGKTLRFPAAMAIVVPDTRLDFSEDTARPRLIKTDFSPLLSACATAVVKFAEVFIDGHRLRELYESFEAAESIASADLCPVGVEIQLPTVHNNHHIAWKELFRSVGIPSRRRPECGRMLEASLPPAASTAPVEAFLRMLIEFGVVTQPQDIGIHVSLQGNLGQNARYLAFPQLFLNRPIRKTPRPGSSRRLVMSKGFVHLDDEVRPCSWYDAEPIRTEMRVFIAGIEKHGDTLIADESLIEAVRATHVIGSAMLAAVATLQAAAAEYVAEIKKCLDGFPNEFGCLLDANFYEATGDYRDVKLLKLLPILDQYDAMKNVSTPALLEKLRVRLSGVRRSAMNGILEITR